MGLFNKFISTVKSIFTKETPEIKPKSVSKSKPVSQLTNIDFTPISSVDTYTEELKLLKSKLQPVISEANTRWERLDNLDLRSLAVSRALEETGEWGFSISRLTDKESVIAEATRARVFLKDETSTVQGAELYTREESAKQWLGQFGNQYNNWENKFKKFNTSVINEEDARTAFRAYRMVEELGSSMIYGEGGYGSENTIIAIYDMIQTGGITDSEDAGEIAAQMLDFLERKMGIKRQEFEDSFIESNEVGYILDVIEADDDYLGRGSW